jgi:hypothetical protein
MNIVKSKKGLLSRVIYIILLVLVIMLILFVSLLVIVYFIDEDFDITEEHEDFAFDSGEVLPEFP